MYLGRWLLGGQGVRDDAHYEFYDCDAYSDCDNSTFFDCIEQQQVVECTGGMLGGDWAEDAFYDCVDSTLDLPEVHLRPDRQGHVVWNEPFPVDGINRLSAAPLLHQCSADWEAGAAALGEEECNNRAALWYGAWAQLAARLASIPGAPRGAARGCPCAGNEAAPATATVCCAAQRTLRRASAAERLLQLHAEGAARAGVESGQEWEWRAIVARWPVASPQRRGVGPPRRSLRPRRGRGQRGRPARCGLRLALAAELGARRSRCAELRRRCAALQHRLGSLQREFRSRTADLRGRLVAERRGSMAALAEARRQHWAEADAARRAGDDWAARLRAARCSHSLIRAEQSARDAVSEGALGELATLGEAFRSAPRWRGSCAVPTARRPRRRAARTATKTARSEAAATEVVAATEVGDEYVWGRKVRRMGYFDDVHRRWYEPERHARRIDPETITMVTKKHFIQRYANRCNADRGPLAGYEAWAAAQSYASFVLNIYPIAFCIGRYVPRRWAPVSRAALLAVHDSTYHLYWAWRAAEHFCLAMRNTAPVEEVSNEPSTAVIFMQDLTELKDRVTRTPGNREQKSRFVQRIDAWLWIMQLYCSEFRDMMRAAKATRHHMRFRFNRLADVLAPRPNGEPRQ